jgi:hypothetical protein
MIPDATVTVLLTAVVISAVLIGGCIVYFAHRAATRIASKPLAMFSYGFGVLTLGYVAGGSAAILSGLTAQETLLVQGVFVLLGFGLLMRSLYVDLAAPSPAE